MRRMLERIFCGLGLISAAPASAAAGQAEILFQHQGEVLIISDLLTLASNMDNAVGVKPPNSACDTNHYVVELAVTKQGQHGTITTRQEGRAVACITTPQQTALVQVTFAKGDKIDAVLTVRSGDRIIATTRKGWAAPVGGKAGKT